MSQDPRQLQSILSELKRREALQAKTVDLLGFAFDKQRDFIRDPNTRKACLCSRRSGKSYAAALYLISTALDNPKCTVLYLTLTKERARKIMVKDVLTPIFEQLKLQVKHNKTTNEFTFPNGSKLYLSGADHPGELEKILGEKYALVVIDECASFKPDKKGGFSEDKLGELITKLTLSVADYGGTIALIGTPSNYINNFFYDLTRTGADTKGWSVHRWTWKDNPHTIDALSKVHDKEVADIPNLPQTNLYKQHWLGEWAIDESALCYRYNSTNLCPPFPVDGYQFVLGIDLGFNDATAFLLAAYHPHDPTLYFVESHKASALDFTAVALFTQQLRSRYPIHKFIVDGANKQGVQEMRNRHLIPFEPAEKQGKYDYIHMMNADFTTLRIRIFNGPNQALTNEYAQLVWDEKDRTQERSNCQNHLADAALYAWRASRNYRHTPAPPQLTPNSLDPRTETPYRPSPHLSIFTDEDEETNTLIDTLDKQWKLSPSNKY